LAGHSGGKHVAHQILNRSAKKSRDLLHPALRSAPINDPSLDPTRWLHLLHVEVLLSSSTENAVSAERFPPGFAVVDLETTGLRWKADRIIEIAVVRLDTAGQVLSEYVTLVDPERHPGATHIHGLTADDLQGAPRFVEVLQDLVHYLDGAVFVGHNVNFDASFLREEFLRAGLLMPRVPLLCTREMTQAVHPRLGEYRLAACCQVYGITQGTEHRALEDARATATLFGHLWNDEIIQRDAPRDVQHARSIVWPSITQSSRRLTREEAVKQRKVENARLGEMAANLPAGATQIPTDGYLSLLDEILEDRQVTEEKAAKAKTFVESKGFLQDDVLAAHQAYLTYVARWVLEADLGQGLGADDVRMVTQLLGLAEENQAKALENAQAERGLPLRTPHNLLQEETTVCFTGNPIPSKHELEGRAIAAKLMVKESVTKKLDLLVVDEPRSMSNKAQKARSIGTRLMAVPVFLTHLAALRKR
jgi:DNA polymerase III subunit epsilon